MNSGLRTRRAAIPSWTQRTLCLAALLGAALAAPAHGIERELAPDEAAARLPEQEFASEFWELAGRFDTGHVLFARVLITNIGIGDRNAAVVGHVVRPDGSVWRFKKAKPAGEWQLTEDRLRIEIGSALLFDQRGESTRFRVDRNGGRIDLAFASSRRPARSPVPADARYGFDLLEAASPAEATLFIEGMSEPLRMRGRVALTHRWMPTLEASLVQRRVEFFSLEGDTPLYFTEITTPDGEVRSWLVVEHDGRPLEQSTQVRASIRWSAPGDAGFARPEGFVLEGDGMSVRVATNQLLLRFDPLEDLPLLVRRLVELRMRPGTIWSASPFELSREDASGGQPLRERGIGLTHVTYFNPIHAAGIGPAVRAPGT